MPFEKVETQVDFPAQERRTLKFWDDIQAFQKLREIVRGKPKWSFLDGPITANNPMGVHHAWGRTYKDAYQRYFAMTGHDLRWQNGFDCQGLWVEVEVERDLKQRGMKLDSKRDIENLVAGDRFKSIDTFVTECKDRVNKFARRQTEQSIRLGYWMDWDRTDADWEKSPDERKSYFTMAERNNYAIWGFLKKCFDRKLVYKAFDAMPWCGRCGAGISQQEMNEGYKLVAHRSVFVKFPLRGRTNEYLLAWTTTPWTLSSNVGAAVNPNLTYLKVKHKPKHDEEFYYVAKGAFTVQRLEEQFKRKEWVEGVPKLKTLEQIFKEKGGYEIVGEVKGADMVGWAYDGPFDELPAQQHAYGYPIDIATVVEQQKWGPAETGKAVHRVIAWDMVGETEGTGIVHIAPGCGKEDFALGKQVGLVPIAPLDDSGVFVPGFGELSGKSALDPATIDWILDNLQKKGLLLAVEKYPHSYPHCWRCKTELLFRLVDEWFIGMSWREEIMRVVEGATFLPEELNGRARELDWLKNMGDWMISKKRFWGLALPIWVDEKTGDFEVIGSREELKARAVEGWSEFDGHTPHRPWIDLVKIRNPKSGNLMSRIPDVGNPWLDAGIVPYSTMGYFENREEWKQWFPADFIVECFPGQFRNWFYAILAMSTMMEQKPPFKVLLGHALVRDDQGEEMHKSKGNSIAFEDASDNGYETVTKDGKKVMHPPLGADLMRWMYCRQNPLSNINFGPTLADEVRSKVVMKLWNTYAFFSNYARLDGFDPAATPIPVSDRPDIDRWILSDLQHLIATSRKSFEAFRVVDFCLEAERFIDDKLSNWYVRRNRRRFWKSDKGSDKTAAYQTLYEVLTTLAKLIAPIVPFLAEELYQNLVSAVHPKGSVPTSVHHCPYPEPNASLIDAPLSEEMDAVLDLVSLGSAARNAVKIKVRQPLAELKIQPGGDADRRAVARFADQITEELNLKKVTLHTGDKPLLSFEVKLNPKAAGPKFGQRIQAVQKAIAAANHDELAAQLQSGKPVDLKLDGDPALLEIGDVWIMPKTPKEWAGLADRARQVLLDARITPDLMLEGLAREVVRHVQSSRKEADLQAEDRITLHVVAADADLAKAIDQHWPYISTETLATSRSATSLGDGAFKTEVKIDGKPLAIELKKA